MAQSMSRKSLRLDNLGQDPPVQELKALASEAAQVVNSEIQREGPVSLSDAADAKTNKGNENVAFSGTDNFQAAPDQSKAKRSFLGGIVQAAAGAALGCWCAALYYPLGSRDWWACRNWILQGWTSPVGKGFAYLYKRHGLRWSEYLIAHPKLMAYVKPFFVWANRRGKSM